MCVCVCMTELQLKPDALPGDGDTEVHSFYHTRPHIDCPHKIRDSSLLSQALHKLRAPKGFTVMKGWATGGMFCEGDAGVEDKTYFLADRKFNFLPWLMCVCVCVGGGAAGSQRAAEGASCTQSSHISPPRCQTVFSPFPVSQTCLRKIILWLNYLEIAQTRLSQHLSTYCGQPDKCLFISRVPPPHPPPEWMVVFCLWVHEGQDPVKLVFPNFVSTVRSCVRARNVNSEQSWRNAAAVAH